MKVCYYCGKSVEPTPEGFCPSCTHRFRPAEEGQEQFELSGLHRNAGTPQSRSLIKVAIVLVVFPVMARVIMWLLGFPLALLVYLLPLSWQSALSTPLIIVTVALGLGGAFLISRKIWPAEEPPAQW